MQAELPRVVLGTEPGSAGGAVCVLMARRPTLILA